MCFDKPTGFDTTWADRRCLGMYPPMKVKEFCSDKESTSGETLQEYLAAYYDYSQGETYRVL